MDGISFRFPSLQIIGKQRRPIRGPYRSAVEWERSCISKSCQSTFTRSFSEIHPIPRARPTGPHGSRCSFFSQRSDESLPRFHAHGVHGDSLVIASKGSSHSPSGLTSECQRNVRRGKELI